MKHFTNRTLLEYIRRNLKFGLLFMLYMLVFSVLFSLQNIPLDAILYGIILSTFFVIVILVFRFSKFHLKHQHLLHVSKRATLNIDDLPKPRDLIENDYQTIIKELHQAYQKLDTDSNYRHQNMLDYYSMWVHQIKTPISALYLVIDQQQNEQSLSMKTELFKIEQYVDMVLQYLKLESETSDLRFDTVDLVSMIRASVRKYRMIFIEKGISLHFEEMNRLMITDEKWFCFALEQILSNALKYTHKGSITIKLSETQPDVLLIQDTGIGIHADDLPRIFDKGFTGYNGRLDKKSSGIGLYLVKRALNKLSHDIQVTSEVGKGTTVAIDISRKPQRFE